MRKLRSARMAVAIGLGLGLVSLPPVALAVSPPVNSAPPEISGTFQVGATLSASDGTWVTGPPITDYSYQWQRCVTGSASVSATGSMSTARSRAMSQLLTDGKVLVAGGTDAFLGNTLTSAELYNPNSGTFSSTGSMSYKRTNSAVAGLANGKVLFVGGGGSFGTPLTAEVFDPTSGTFSLTTGSPVVARSDATANRLANGKVLVAGGTTSSNPTASAELFDPASGTFASTGSLATGRTQASAVVLEDGRVLIAGGQNNGILSSAELYDPTSGTFSATGSLNVARTDASAVRLPDGRVLIEGGTQGGSNQLASAEIYNPESGTFSLTGPMPVGSNANSISLLKDGRVLVAGGFSSSGPTASTSIFDPITKTFSAGPSLGTARGETASAVLEDGRVLIAGGWTPGDTFTATAETFVPGAVTCSDIPNTDFWQYQPQPADYLQRLRVKVTASNGVNPPGEAESEISPYIGGSSPSISADPTISVEGDPEAPAQVGRALVLDPKTWTGTPTPTVTYQWLSCEQSNFGDCDPIGNATSLTYVPKVADAGRFLAARVTGTNLFGSNYATSNRRRIQRAIIGPVSVTGPGRTKRGKATAFKVAVENSGDVSADDVKVVVFGKGVSLRTSLGYVQPDEPRSLTVRPKFKKTGRVSVTFKVTSSNGGTKSVRRVIRVIG